MPDSLRLLESTWFKLKKKLVEDYSRSTVLISWRCKQELGFVARDHYERHSSPVVYLDFFDDQLKTMFLLKYSDYISAESKLNQADLA